MRLAGSVLSFFFSVLPKGNYDSYMKTRAELEENQMKQYSREQDQIKHMKVFTVSMKYNL